MIIRHMFPRKRWVTFDTIAIYPNWTADGLPSSHLHLQRDQFGNIRKVKISP